MSVRIFLKILHEGVLNSYLTMRFCRISSSPMSLIPERIAESSASAYFSRIGGIYGGEKDAFLINPFWSEQQRAAAETLIRLYSEKKSTGTPGKIFIASGGSGGRIRFIAHTPETLEASARALIAALNLPSGVPLNGFVCLPPWHVSGFMPWVRSRVSGGKIFTAENGRFREDEILPEFRKNSGEFWMNSLVPTQLARLLKRPAGIAWLKKFDFILLGGARVPAELIARAKEEGLNFGIGYGMTETASLVALWRPQDGEMLAGTPLPHAKFFLTPDSRIAIEASSLGETLNENGEILPNPAGRFFTNDEGKIDADGRVIVLGRADRYINSGGEKTDPVLVENALRAAGAQDALVIGEPDPEWGERVVALVKIPVPENLIEKIKKDLPPWMLPKRLIGVPALPFDAKGKLDREKLNALLAGNSA